LRAGGASESPAKRFFRIAVFLEIERIVPKGGVRNKIKQEKMPRGVPLVEETKVGEQVKSTG